MVKSGEGLSAEALSSIEKHALVNASLHEGRADVGAVMSKVLGEFPELRKDPSRVAKEARRVVQEVNSKGEQEQSRLLASKYPEAVQSRAKTQEVHRLPPLKGAVEGKACFRLPPEPSGFMHIGHAMAFTVNSLYKDMYRGELWLRFEDTNPKKVMKRYYDSFRRGIQWLGIEWDHEKNVSQDMEVMYEYGRRMLSDGLAYACSCDADKVKKMRFAGTVCEHRGNSPEKNLRVWDELLAKKHKEGAYVIRFKGDMTNADYSLRDPNVFRVIERPHPLTRDRYTLWPTYDLANTIEDHICGVTHVLRSAEFHTELQELIRRSLNLRKVEVVQFSRYNFKGTPVAKRLLRPLVEENMVSGWDDPRMPTVEGVRRRGILPKTIREFTVQVGYTKAEHVYDWSMLFSLNRKLLDPVSKRLFFVPDPVSLEVTGAPPKTVRIPFHPDKDLGDRTFVTAGRLSVPSADIKALKEGVVFRLMDLYNVELTSGGPTPKARYAGDQLLAETRKLQWVTPDSTPVSVSVPDVLFDEGGGFNKESLKSVAGLAERSVSSLKEGDIVQFPRFGFCRLDSGSNFILAHR